MKREAKLLLTKAVDSLILSIELFNRPQDRSRTSGSLIHLDHAFEMLLKAAILYRGGKIREKYASETIGFDACVRRGLSDGNIKFLGDDQAVVLRAINGLRDAAQHHLLDISEGQLYIHMQSGFTLFRDLLKNVFDRPLVRYLPNRVLPIATSPPTDIATLFDSEINEIKKLLRPGSRRQTEALARLRPLAILDGTVLGNNGQPSDADLRRLHSALMSGKAWNDVFKGASALEMRADGTGPSLSLRLSKRNGIPVQLVPEGAPDVTVVAVKRVNEIDYYSLSITQLATKLDLTVPKFNAVVDYLGLRENTDHYKVIKIGGSIFKRYSPKALSAIQEALQSESIEEIWSLHHPRR